MDLRSGENPLVQVLKLVVADPKLRRQFVRDPASVFKQVGLGCPLVLVADKVILPCHAQTSFG